MMKQFASFYLYNTHPLFLTESQIRRNKPLSRGEGIVHKIETGVLLINEVK